MLVLARCKSTTAFILPVSRVINDVEVKVNQDIVPGIVYALDNEDPYIKAAFDDGRLFYVGPAENTSPVIKLTVEEIVVEENKKNKKKE